MKEKYCQTFDVLNKQEDILNQEFRHVEMLLKQDEKKDEIIQIKEMDEYDEEMADMQGDNNLHNDPYDA